MAGFLDVLLRGLLLVFVTVAVGGLTWLGFVLRVEPKTKPDATTATALRVVALAAALAALAQTAVGLLLLADLAAKGSALPLGPYLATTFARVAVARVVLALALAVVAVRLSRRPGGTGLWGLQAALGLGLVAASAALSHAAARVSDRALLGIVDALHQLAVAAWVGGLAHLTIYVARGRHGLDARAGSIARRFSALALTAVGTLVASGVVLTILYVGQPAALVGTAYGVMILSKITLLAAALSLAFANFTAVRHAAADAATPRLGRFVEVELGLAVTVLFAAASLTSLPPAVDVLGDRATPAEVAARFRPAPPRLTSPPIAELLSTADPLMAPPGDRKPVERAWSEYNHHWAGFFVLSMGLLALLDGAGWRPARHWPLVLLGLATFLFVRDDPRAWPLGPAGFWESMTLPDVLQHRAFVLLVVAFAAFEWAVRTGRLPATPWNRVFPMLCAVGGGLLLTHSHAMFNLKDEFLTEVTHAPLGILGVFTGWSRWLEVRLPEAGSLPAWLWRVCLLGVGVLLLFYREA